MRVLVIGNGGREDAICKKLSESKKLTKLYCSKGNAGTLRYAENVDLKDNDEILDFAKKNVDLVIVGPENPLCEGIVDMFDGTGVKVFGPHKKAARLEGSKDFTKQFLIKYELPTAQYKTIYSKEEGIEALKSFKYPVVIKADGLCAGKGVGIFQNEKDAHNYLNDLFVTRIFGAEADKAVIEEFLTGSEASLLCVVSGSSLIPLESARDYKRIYDNDEGDNTGGVGCYSPSELFNDELNEKIKILLDRISYGLKSEGLEYAGILFIGLMIENNEPKILEFNVRFGDPETEVVLPRMQSDLLEIIQKAMDRTLEQSDLKWSDKVCMTVLLTSDGYPHSYEKHKLISGEIKEADMYVYHNNTIFENGSAYSDGGRVLSVTALDDSYEKARTKIYKHIDEIHFENMKYRKDIGVIKEHK